MSMVRSGEVYFEDEWRAPELTGDLKPNDLIYLLRTMRFRNGLLPVRLDRDVRNFIVDAIAHRGGDQQRRKQ
jgi:hypothetical protein